MRFGESTDMDQRSRLEFKVCGLSLADSPAVAWRVVKVMLGKPFMALCRSAIPTQQCNKQLRKTTQNRGVSFPPPASAAKAYVVLSAVLLFLLGRIAVLRSTVKPRLHDTTCCQTGCQTDLTTGCIVYTNIQPIVKPVWQPVWQPAVSCIQTFNRLSNGFDNRFDNRLDVCLHDTAGCQTGCTTGCIVSTGFYRSSSMVGLSVCLSRSWALQKPLNRSRCRLRCWLGWVPF